MRPELEEQRDSCDLPCEPRKKHWLKGVVQVWFWFGGSFSAYQDTSAIQLFLDLLQKLKKCCFLFHCIKTETAKISSAWTSLKKRVEKIKGHAIKLVKILPTCENSACHHMAANAVTRTTEVVVKIQHYTVRPQLQGGALPNTKI